MRSVCLFLLAVAPVWCIGQVAWPPVDAVWHYDAPSHDPGTQYYTKWQVVGDAVLGGRGCRKVTVTDQVADNEPVAAEYLFEEGGKVYYWRYNRWCLLHDWEARQGDTIWTVSPEATPSFPDTLSPMVVDTVAWAIDVLIPGTLMEGADSLRVQFLRPARGNQMVFHGPVVESVGCLHTFLPMHFDYIPDYFDGPMRCYNGGGINLQSVSDCEEYRHDPWESAIHWLPWNPPPPPDDRQGPLVYPNPANEWVAISPTTDHATIRIVDVHGREMLSAREIEGDKWLNVVTWAEGVYFVQIKQDVSLHTLRLVVVR